MILLAANELWLGLRLQAGAYGKVVITSVSGNGPSASVPAASTLAAIGAPDAEPLPLEPLDLIEEPDAIETYDGFNRFMKRQTAFAAIMGSEAVTLHLDGGETVEVRPAPSRPLGDLPGTFWFQLGCSIVLMVIASWVSCLKPADRQASLFVFAGYAAALSIFIAAIYSSREFAIDGSIFRALSALNHVGSLGFGIFMIGLFTRYPKPLGIDWLYPATAAVMAVWFGFNQLQLFPDPATGFYLCILLLMIGIVILIGLQYRATRGDVPSRRALLWLGLSVVVGGGAFTALMAVPIIGGSPPILTQAHALGFFPLIYLGVALGLTRYRLFELDRWAFDVLTYVLAVFLFVAIDFLLVVTLAINYSVSLGITALVIGLVYLPLRNWVAGRFLSRSTPDTYDLYRTAADVVLQPTPTLRAAHWRESLDRHFQPLDIETVASGPPTPTVTGEGVAFELPAYPWSPPLRLMHHMKGVRLFGAPHVQVVETFAALVAEAEASREAYDRGVREERRRIGRDLHDNVGAMLMSSLRTPDDGHSRSLVRDALSDIREIVNGLSDRREPLANVVAQLRAETAERLHDIYLDWPAGQADEAQMPLPYPVYRNFTSAHREMISNIIRHSGASSVRVATELDGRWLKHRIENDLGGAAPPNPDSGGNGIANLSQRASELGGAFSFSREGGRAVAEIRLPLQAGGMQ